jgi:hypothetical protein
VPIEPSDLRARLRILNGPIGLFGTASAEIDLEMIFARIALVIEAKSLNMSFFEYLQEIFRAVTVEVIAIPNQIKHAPQ